jgi:hypothetical protein
MIFGEMTLVLISPVVAEPASAGKWLMDEPLTFTVRVEYQNTG